MILDIEPRGVLIHECSLAGETRANDVVPAHPNGIQVSRDRWLLIYATRGFARIDDDRSIVYQLRADAPTGRVIREGHLARSVTDWAALGDGNHYRKETGHPVLFGVPRGALINGKPAINANLFVAKWRRNAHAEPGTDGPPDLLPRTQGVEWMQFRLNETQDGIEILQPPMTLRQAGYESGEAFCRHEKLRAMNQSFVQAVPLNRKRTEWGDCNHFEGGIAVLKYVYNMATGLYEWREIGPLLRHDTIRFFEASLARYRDDWVVAGRPQHGGAVGWYRCSDPLHDAPAVTCPATPITNAPITAYSGPDGSLQLFTGSSQISSYGNGRDPLFCWEIDPDRGFAASRCQTVFDAEAFGLPIRRESLARVDMCKLLPHAGGSTGIIVHRVRTKSINYPCNTKAVINAAEKDCTAIYYAQAHYDTAYPAMWSFAS